MNEVLTPTLPDESLVPEMMDGEIKRFYVDPAQVREDQRHRLELDGIRKMPSGEVLCYRTPSGWVPELRDNFQTIDQQREFVSGKIDEVLETKNTEGRFFREGDNRVALNLLGDSFTGTFPPKRNRGHAAVPMLHSEGHKQHGHYPHGAETEGHLRIMAVLNDKNGGRLADDGNVVVPHKPHSHWNPENINSEAMPFFSVPTDTMAIAMPKVNGGSVPEWTAQVLPHGKLSMYPWSTQLHYSDGFITGMVAYVKEDGDVAVLDLDGHLERAADNAKRLGFVGLDKEFLRKILMNQLRGDRRWIPEQGNAAENRYYIRFTVVPNATGPVLKGPEQILLLAGSPIGPYKVKKEEQLKVALLGPRPVNESVATTKNVTNYQAPVGEMGRFIEKTGRTDLHEALFVKEDRTPQEGTSSNVFFIRTSEDKTSGQKRVTLFSPDPRKANVLPGRTVYLAMNIAKYLGWDVVGYEHDALDMDQLIREAREGSVQMGMTGTAMGIRQIQELISHRNGVTESIRVNGDQYSPEMQMLQDIYEQILAGQHELAAKYMQTAA